MNESWILVGMMGAGKTALGRQIAATTGREHVDTDLLLQRRLGRPIPQLFKIYGESTFRDHETSILRSLEPGCSVVSTGGGIVIRSANWDEMNRLGKTIFIDLPIEELIERLAASKKVRPLLLVENWTERLRALYQERLPLYRRADIAVQISGLSIPDAAASVVKTLEAE